MKHSAFLLLSSALYLFSLSGRQDHPVLPELKKHIYTHRGLFNNENGIPENSLAAFRRTAAHPGYGCEFDVHLTKDNVLVVIHDSNLSRACGVNLNVEDLTLEELKSFPLFDTAETIPTLQEVLEVLGSAGAPLVVEVKCFRNNADQLTQATVEALKDYPAPYCIESFDPRALIWLRKNAPDICRGQLSCDHLKNPGEMSVFSAASLTYLVENFLTRPDFIAYEFGARKNLSVWLTDKLWHIAQVRWTIRNQRDFDTVIHENSIPIFEHFTPEEKENA